MKNNTKGKNNITSYIILVCILLVAVVAIFMLLNSAKNQAKAGPLTTTTTKAVPVQPNGGTTTTTTSTTSAQSITDIVYQTTTTVVVQKEIKVEPFSASLEVIMEDLTFDLDYAVSTEYSGAVFNFNCVSYDSDTLKCNEGSGLLNIGTALIPLYTYKDADDNILKHQYDYHIMVTDKYVFLTETYSFKKTGVTKIYDKNGTFITSVNNVIMGYKVANKEYLRIYPTLTDDVFYYYTYEDGVVHVSALNLVDFTIYFADTIDGAVVY